MTDSNNKFLKIFEAANAFGVGFFSCYLIRANFDWDGVLASAFVGLLASFLPQTKIYHQKRVQASIYAGSFAGMSSTRVLDSLNDFILVTLVGGIIIVLLEDRFVGVGGKLGTIAFLAMGFLVLYRGFV